MSVLLLEAGKIVPAETFFRVVAHGDGDEETKVFFTKFEAQVPNESFAEWLEQNKCRPAERALLEALNRDDPQFAKNHLHGTQWREGSRWHFLAFSALDGKTLQAEGCDNRGTGWTPRYWVAYVHQ